MLSRFHLIPERYGQTDRRTDRRTDRQTDRQRDLLYQYRASVCWRAIKTERLKCEVLKQKERYINPHIYITHCSGTSHWRSTMHAFIDITKSERGRTQVSDGDVVAGRVNIAPVDVRHSFAVANHVAADDVSVFRRHPAHHHWVGERTRSDVRRLAGHGRFCADSASHCVDSLHRRHQHHLQDISPWGIFAFRTVS